MRLMSCALIGALMAPAGVIAAKPDIPPEQMVMAPGGAVGRCMSRPTTPGDAPQADFVIPVAPEQVEEFQAKGYAPAPCKGPAQDLARHKKIVCELALGNEAVQRRTVQIFGVNGKELCAATKKLLPDSIESPPAN